MRKTLILIILFNSCCFVFAQNNNKYVIKKVEIAQITKPPLTLRIVDTLNPSIHFNAVPNEFGGLKPFYPIAISYEPIPCSIGKEISCFYDNSRLVLNISNLYVLMNNEVVEINSFSKFKEIFSPIDNKEEALSFVAAWSHSSSIFSKIIYNFDFLKDDKELKVLKNELTPTSVTEVENGYKVIIITNVDDYYENEYFVNYVGDVKRIRREMIIQYFGTRWIID